MPRLIPMGKNKRRFVPKYLPVKRSFLRLEFSKYFLKNFLARREKFVKVWGNIHFFIRNLGAEVDLKSFLKFAILGQ